MHMTAKTRHGWKKMTSPVALLVVFNGRQVRVPDLLLFMLGQRMGGCLTVRNIQTCNSYIILCLSGKGSRLIILHAGSENGWVPNCSLVFKSSKTTGK